LLVVYYKYVEVLKKPGSSENKFAFIKK